MCCVGQPLTVAFGSKRLSKCEESRKKLNEVVPEINEEDLRWTAAFSHKNKLRVCKTKLPEGRGTLHTVFPGISASEEDSVDQHENC